MSIFVVVNDLLTILGPLLKQNSEIMRKLLFLLVCLSLTAGQLLAQSHTIKGKVTDDKGAGIPNASILVKGTTIGTTSESDGTFSLNVPATAKTLVIASLNFSAQEISI